MFMYRVGPHAKVLKIFENWHVAFHGTQTKYLQPILNNGAQLLMAGMRMYFFRSCNIVIWLIRILNNPS